MTARGVRSREALLAAARRLFQRRGYANTKIADITREAGRASGSFYTYFANKEEVLEQMAEDFKAEVDAMMSTMQLTEVAFAQSAERSRKREIPLAPSLDQLSIPPITLHEGILCIYP